MSALKTIKVPEVLNRAAAMEKGEGDAVRISISSDTPYLRYDWWKDEEYYEVLDHSPGGFDDSRLKAGLPMLYNHERRTHLGRARKFESNGKRITVEDLVWSDSEEAKQKKSDFEKGVLVDTSVGYSIIGEGECVGAEKGIPVYKFKWEPHEFSLVTIPADITVGVGRNRGHKPDGEPREISIRDENGLAKQADNSNKQTTNRTTMPDPIVTEPPKINVEQERKDAGNAALKAYGDKRTQIEDFIKKLPKQPWRDAATTIAADYLKIEDTRTFDQFRAEALNKCEAEAVNVPQEDSRLGLSNGEIKRFSFRKALFEMAMFRRGVGKGLSGHEKAICEAAEKLYTGKDEREFTGMCIPDDITDSRFDEVNGIGTRGMQNLSDEVNRLRAQVAHIRALNATVFTAGGALVGVDLLGGSMIDILRNAVLIGNGALAITELSGLVSNISIPKQTQTTTVYWLAEGAAITQSQEAFAQLNLSPRRAGMATQYTKQLLAQASIGVEAFVRQDQMQALAVEEDRVCINGTGVNGEPIGILNTTGVLANVTFGGAAVWGDMVALEYGLENANVRNGEMAILTSPLTKSYLKQTVVVASSTFPIFLWGKNEGYPVLNGVKPGVVNDYPAYATKNVTTNVMIQGVFRNLIKARWAGFDVVVDPYTGALSELINIIINTWLDIGLRYPQSFNATTDAPTAP